jgi:Lysozyme like domain
VVVALNFGQLFALATKAGFTGQSASTISAIALAESGGNPDAVNYNDPHGGSFGLTQINGVHPGAIGALDPQTAFNLAYQVSNGGTDFSPWSTYNSGAYQKYLASPVETSGGPSGTTLTFDPTDPGNIAAGAGDAGTGGNTVVDYGPNALPDALAGTDATGTGFGDQAAAAAAAAASGTDTGGSFWEELSAWIGDSLLRIGLVILGIVLIGVAVYALTKQELAKA